jgi:hypothetical protein
MNANPVVARFRSCRSRRDQVLQCVSALTRTAMVDDAEQWARRVRSTLEGLGPLFASFAAYVGSRIDLLTTDECNELARCAVLSRELAGAAAELHQIDPVLIATTALTGSSSAARQAWGSEPIRSAVLVTTGAAHVCAGDRADRSVVSLLTEVVMLPFTAFLYGMDLLLKAMQAVQSERKTAST